jgi:hypothetical protein
MPTNALRFVRSRKELGRLLRPVSEIFKTVCKQERAFRYLPLKFANDPTSSHPCSILQPFRESHVTLVPDSQLTSVH